MATTDELIKQVQNLTSATTDLLDATNVSKERLNAAVDSATGSAQSAELANISAVEARAVTIAATSEAIAAKDQAVAIVHNDEGSLTSKPGAYPVADSKGHLDIGWTPLLQAMYPYSGVIGSVDKGDLFQFGSTADWANKIRLLPSRFNIAGKFVVKDIYQTYILPEAESTADRAIAFDDIFLDWNGNVQTYRSITPHRTTTGYDRDKIAEEHGYTKVQTGLYKTGDTYALLLGRVARRNKGAYHPVFNPEGVTGIFRKGSTTFSYSRWFEASCRSITSQEDCFKNGHPEDSDSRVHPDWAGGSIRWLDGTKNRPDDKPYDAIYADDFTPLYYSAKNVVDRQALLFDSFNRAVAGEAFSGAEGLSTHFTVTGTEESEQYWKVLVDAPFCHTDRTQTSLNAVYVKGKKYRIETTSSNPAVAYINKDDFELAPFSSGDLLMVENIRSHHFNGYPQKPSARPQFLMVDIIGSLDAMPDEWKANGIPGNWLSVGEEGESLIPDGTSKNFKLSRKCLRCYQVLVSFDKGVTWSDQASTWKADFEGSGNAREQAVAGPACIMVFYRTSANPFELTDNAPQIACGGIKATGSAFAGTVFASNMLSKIPTGTIGNIFGSYKANTLPLVFGNPPQMNQSNAYIPLSHEPALFNGQLTPTVKCYAYLNNAMQLQLIYKEMKHNGESWGDDNKFNIVDKQSTVTDLNGETVIVGQKRVELPYHFDGVLY